MRYAHILTIGINIVAAVTIAIILWFGMFSPPGSYQLQSDGTWQLAHDYEGEGGIITVSMIPFLAMGLLAWLCRKWQGTSIRLLITSFVIAALVVMITGWEANEPWSRGRGIYTALGWILQCLIVGAAYLCCALGWFFRVYRATKNTD